jgi:NAD(P)-dependent dehydrogenase (short-subunit alcohol dehydrogenase family)
VAGGSSGIGMSLVQMLSNQGAHIYTISRTASAGWPPQVKHLPADILGNLSEVAVWLPERLDGLVYAIGSINLKPFNRLTENDFLNDYRLNVLGATKLIGIALAALRKADSASVVLLSSVAAQIGLPYHASISAAKGAVEGLAIGLAAELATQQVRVNVVAPSLTDTPMAQNLLSTPEKREAAAKRHPLGKYGKPEDISNAIAFLLSAEASWITGQVIGVDGGLGKLKTN